MKPLVLPGRGTRYDPAVSPVVGVVLMVAITVMLAATIGSFVIGMGATIDRTPPYADLIAQDAPERFLDNSSGRRGFIQVHHDGGDTLTVDNLQLVIREASTNNVVLELTVGKSGTDSNSSLWDITVNGEPITNVHRFAPGDVMEITHTNNTVSGRPNDDEYDVIVIVIDQHSGQPILDTKIRVR